MKQFIDYPTRAHIELTSRCNFRCLTCKHGYVDYGEDLNDKILDNFIEEILPNILEVEMQGTGESLLSKNFNKLFDAVYNYKNKKMILITNASLFNEELIKKIVNSNFNLIVSLDGSNEFSFRSHRPFGDYNRVLSNLKKFSEEKIKTNNKNFLFTINMVVTKVNYKCIKDLVSLSHKLNIDFLHISEVRQCMPDIEQWNNFRIDNVSNRLEIEDYIKNCEQYAKKLGVGFVFNPYQKQNMIRKKLCISPWKHIFIASNGNVSCCCEQNNVFGNLNEQSFFEIWNGNKLNLFRNNMILGEYDKICSNCCLPWGITYA